MISLSKLEKFLNNNLIYDKNQNLEEIDPYMGNGLLVKGRETIKKVCLAVSASLAVFEKTKEKGCQALIVHHAFNFPPTTRYDTLFQNRYSYLIKNGLSLFGYHFLLDSHPRIGHNVKIIETVGGQPTNPFLHRGQPWGYFGKLKPTPLSKILSILKPKLSPKMVVYPFGKNNVQTVVALSGRGTPIPTDIQYLLDNQVDLFITGEDSEWIREIFREVKINFIAGGHYHTERFGVLALQKIIQQRLGVAAEFIEFENPI